MQDLAVRFPQYFESAAQVAAPSDGESLPVDPGSGQASWVDPPPLPDDAQVTTIEIPDGDIPSQEPPTDVDERDWQPSDYPEAGADAIAFYVPWHSSPARWGIYFVEDQLFAFAQEVARAAGERTSIMAPIVLRQVLFHELTHFRFEVVGTDLEDALARPLYMDYLRYAFGTPVPGFSGPIEEAVATWREVRYARGNLQAFLRPKPPRYPAAAEQLASSAPAGYRDWRNTSSAAKQEKAIATIAGLMTGRTMTTGGWGGWLTEENNGAVPRRWIGDRANLPAVKALEKSAAPLTIRKFERWLRDHQIEYRPTRSRSQGSHYEFEFAGRTEGYGTSKGSNELYFKDTKRLAAFFGYRTVVDFQIAVAERRRMTNG